MQFSTALTLVSGDIKVQIIDLFSKAINIFFYHRLRFGFGLSRKLFSTYNFPNASPIPLITCKALSHHLVSVSRHQLRFYRKIKVRPQYWLTTDLKLYLIMTIAYAFHSSTLFSFNTDSKAVMYLGCETIKESTF
jgi:hypothetical protein